MKDEDKSINVTSYYQSGGITAHSVNFGRPPRTLDSQGARFLRDNLPQDKSKEIEIMCVMGDQEALRFGTEIMDFVKSLGYKNVNGVNQAVLTGPVPPHGLVRMDGGKIRVQIGSNI